MNMRQWTNGNWILLASCILWACFVIYPVRAAQAERPRTVTPATIQDEKEEDWKSKLTTEELSAINKPDSPKDRVKTSLRLAEVRLKNARSHLEREDYRGASEQIMGYAALVEDVGQFSKSSIAKRDKVHKTLEVTLREQLRVLEGIRRDISASHAATIEKALKLVNQIRRQSLGLLLGEGLLTDTEKP
jgi:hypothetical protein